MSETIPYPTTMTILQRDPRAHLERKIVEGVMFNTPLVNRMPAEVITGTQYLQQTRESLPLVGPVPFNAGSRPFDVDYTTQSAETYPYESYFELDKKIQLRYRDQAASWMEDMMATGTKGIMASIERSLFYGKAVSPYGTRGLCDDLGDYMTVSATGSHSSRTYGGATVWALCLSPEFMKLIWGGGKTIAFGPLEEQSVSRRTAEGEEGRMRVISRTVTFNIGFTLKDPYSAARCVNISEAHPLKDDLLGDLVDSFPDGREPNLILMNRKAASLLRKQRGLKYTYLKKDGTIGAEMPKDYDGIPIAITSALINDETEANLKKLAAQTKLSVELNKNNLKK